MLSKREADARDRRPAIEALEARQRAAMRSQCLSLGMPMLRDREHQPVHPARLLTAQASDLLDRARRDAAVQRVAERERVRAEKAALRANTTVVKATTRKYVEPPCPPNLYAERQRRIAAHEQAVSDWLRS